MEPNLSIGNLKFFLNLIELQKFHLFESLKITLLFAQRMVMTIFFSALRPLKTVLWILELKKCFKKLGLDSENHSSENVLYLMHLQSNTAAVYPDNTDFQ